MKLLFTVLFSMVSIWIYGQVYPSPKQMLDFYNAPEQSVKDSLLAHGYKHVLTFANTSKNGYRRYVYTLNCKLQRANSNDWLRSYQASPDSPKEGILFEFSSYDKIVQDPAIEFIDEEQYVRYYSLCNNLGYKHRYQLLCKSRYSNIRIANSGLYKHVSKRSVKAINRGIPGTYPIEGKLFFDLYSLPNHSINKEVNTCIVGVRVSGDVSRRWGGGAGTQDGDKVLWDRQDEIGEDEELEFSDDFLKNKASAAKAKLPQESEIIGTYLDKDRHHIYYTLEKIEDDSYSNNLTSIKRLYALDVIGQNVKPKKLAESDKGMEIIKCPDNIHLIVLGYYKSQGGRFYMSLIDTTTLEEKEIASWENKEELKRSNGYVIDTEYQRIIIDRNGKIIKTIDKKTSSPG